METVLTKQDLRKRIKELKRQHTPEQLQQLSEDVLAKLEAAPEFQKAHTIMAYYSLPDEVYTHAFLEKWASSKRFLLPIVQGDDILLKPYTPHQEMKTGLLNVQEPDSDEFFTDYASIELVIVPGVAFDSAGNRMGRGKGFYDRFLPKVPQAFLLGLCFPFQLVPAVPHESFDKPMHKVVSC